MRRLPPALLFAVCAGPVWAQDEAVELSPLQVTSGRVAEADFAVPQPVTVLTREQIEDRNPQVAAEALRYEPGAFFQQTGPGQGMVIVRGLKGAEVLHLVDGMRLNNAFFRTAPSQYIALLDPNNINQLELLRGPYATLYGSEAMGGVVQVLTPEYRFAGQDVDVRARARAHLSSADLARTTRVEGAAGTSALSVAGGYTYLEYGHRRLAEPGQSPDGQGGVSLAERVAGTGYVGRGYDMKLLWTPATGGEVMLSAQRFLIPSLPRYNEMVPGYDTDGTPGAETALSLYDNARSFYHLRYRQHAPAGFIDGLELHAAHQIVDDDRHDRAADLSTDTFEDNRSALTGFTAQGQSLIGAHQRLVYGVELYRDIVKSRAVREIPPGSRAYTVNGPATFESRFPDGARADDYGVYLMDEWHHGDWLIEAGGRYTYHRTELPRADRAFGAKLGDDDFTGSLGLRRALSSQLAWTLNLGRGFRAPNINDLAQTGRRTGGRIVVANLGLQPERVRSIDTGLKVLTDTLALEAGVFYADYADRITLVRDAVPEGSGDCADDGDATLESCAQNRNIARATYYGFEGGARWALADDWRLRTTVNYTWGEQDVAGAVTPANRVPPLNGQLGLEYRWTCLRVEPTVFWAGRQERLDPDDRSDARIDPGGTAGYAIANLRVSWDLLDDVGLTLEGRNLFNAAYREHGSGIDGSARGIALTAEARFP